MRSTFKVLFYVKKGSEKPNGNLPLDIVPSALWTARLNSSSCKMTFLRLGREQPACFDKRAKRRLSTSAVYKIQDGGKPPLPRTDAGSDGYVTATKVWTPLLRLSASSRKPCCQKSSSSTTPSSEVSRAQQGAGTFRRYQTVCHPYCGSSAPSLQHRIWRRRCKVRFAPILYSGAV